MTIEAFPLAWPDGWERTTSYYRDEAPFTVTMATARDEMLAEINLLVGRYTDPLIILSTNVALRLDGLPYANQKSPEDPGVAVYFTYRKSQRVFACDKYKKVEHNVRAIGKTIGAMRGIERWGASDMLDRAFQGFEALPNPDTPRHWRDVLGATNPNLTWDFIEKQHKLLRSQYHRANDTDRFVEVNKAYQQAKEEYQA